jgi:hypothetical protein
MHSEPLRVPDWLIVDAVRYATGRMSYQVSVTVDWLAQNWQQIPQSAREQIARDLEREFEQDDKARADTKWTWSYPLGMDMDRRQWEKVRALYRQDQGLSVPVLTDEREGLVMHFTPELAQDLILAYTIAESRGRIHPVRERWRRVRTYFETLMKQREPQTETEVSCEQPER